MSETQKLSENDFQESSTKKRLKSEKKEENLKVKTENVETSNHKLVENQNQTQDLWHLSYFVAQYAGQPFCLVCKKILTATEKSDIERHYMACHEKEFRGCYVEDKIAILKKIQNSNCLLPLREKSPNRVVKSFETIKTKPEEEEISLGERRMSLSYEIALKIAQEGSPYFNVKDIQNCIRHARKLENNKMIPVFEMLLSKDIALNKISDLSLYIEQKIKSQLKNCQYFSLYLCEDTRNNYLIIFARITQSDFTSSEELLNLTSMDHLSNENIIEFIKQTIQKFAVIQKCSSVALNGRRFGTSFVNILKRLDISCPIYQLKMIEMEEVGGVLLQNNETIKKIEQIMILVMKMREPNKTLENFKKEAKRTHRSLASQSKLLWLSHGNYFEKIFRLQEDIINYIKTKNDAETTHYQDFFKDSHFLSELAFLADLTTMIKKYNLNLVRPNQCIVDLTKNIVNLHRKVQIHRMQIKKNEFGEVPYDQLAKMWSIDLSQFKPIIENIIEELDDELLCCNQLSKTCSVNLSEFDPIVKNITEELNTHLDNFLEVQIEIQLFDNPFLARLEYQRLETQFELCYLQVDSIFLRKLRGVEIFKMLNKEHYPRLIDFGLRIFSTFGSLQIFENAESIIENLATISTSNTTRTTERCKEIIRVGISKTAVNFLELIRK